jgi:hypothetical protein
VTERWRAGLDAQGEAVLAARPDCASSLAAAEAFLAEYAPADLIAPAVSVGGEAGELTIEWHGDACDLEVDIEDGRVGDVYVWIHGERESTMDELPVALGRLQTALALLAPGS